ncbi:MAG: ATP-binding protein [Pseudomonadota bacterium]
MTSTNLPRLVMNLILIACAWSPGAWSGERGTSLDVATVRSGTEVSAFLSVLEDPSAQLTLADVRSPANLRGFEPLGGKKQFALTKSAYWFRLPLSNSSPVPQERLLVIGYGNHQKIAFHEVSPGTAPVRTLSRNAAALINEVDIANRLPIYRVVVDAREHKTVFLQIQSPTIRTSTTVWTPTDFLVESRLSDWWYMVFLGIVVAANLYLAVITATTPTPLYRSLLTVTVMMLILQLTLQGHIYMLLGGLGGLLNYGWLLIQAWTGAALVRFSYLFLGGPRLARWLRAGFHLFVGAFVLAGLASLVDYRNALYVVIPLIFSGSAYLILVAIYQVLKRNRDAQLYLVGWTPILVLGVLVNVNGAGWVGDPQWGPIIAAAWIPSTVIVFGFTVVLRTRTEHRESTEKSTFMAILSHEVRTPLTAILGTVDLLRNSPLNTRQTQLIETLSQSGRALLALLNDVLSLSKFEAGSASLTLAPANPERLVKSMVELMSARAEDKGLTIDFCTSGSVPPLVRLDEARLRQVLLNLLSNAIKFSHQGRIAVSLTGSMTGPDTAQLRFSVVDEGIGIAEQDQARLFKPFSQIDSSASRPYEGTGLGLSISRQLVSLMGGEIAVQSEPGRGSTFSFSIEAAVADGSELIGDSGVTPDAARGSGIALLLVDDIEINRQVVGELLRNAGFSVTPAGSAQSALERLEHQHFDAVVTDVFMPELSGLDLTKAIRADGREIPILGLTAASDTGTLAECLQSGMTQVLRKPTDATTLRAVLLTIVGDGRDTGQQILLDTRILSDFRESLGEPRLVELLGDARARLEALMHAMEQAATNDDRLAVCAHSHSLAGAAATIGLMRLSDSAETLAQQLRKEDGPPGDGIDVATLRALVDESLKELGNAPLDRLLPAA